MPDIQTRFPIQIDDGSTTVAIVGTALSVTGSVTTVPSGTFTTSVEYAEDSTHTSGHRGSFMLAVRNDAVATTFTSADGDYSPISVDNVGRIFVTGTVTSAIAQSVTIVPSGTQTVTGTVTNVPSGTQAVSIAQTVTTVYSGTQTVAITSGVSAASDYAEDSVHTTGHVGSFMLAVRNDSAATTFASANGDYSPISVDNVGRVLVTGTVTSTIAQSVTIVPSGTQAVSIAQSVTIVPSGTQTVTGTVTSVPSGTQAVSIAQTVTTVYSGTQTVAVSGSLTTADGYAEDSVHTTGHVGSFILAVRNDSAATTFASATGDYSPISVDNVGRVFVTGTVTSAIAQSVTIVPSGTQTVTGTVTSVPSGTQAVSIAQTVTTTYSGTQTVAVSGSLTTTDVYAEDSVHTTGHTGSFILAVRNDSAATTFASASGDYSPISVDNVGRVFVTGTVTSAIAQSVTIVPSGTQAVSIAQSVTIVPSGTQTVTGTVTTVTSGTQTVVPTNAYAEDSPHTTAHVGSFVMGVRNDLATNTVTSANGDYSPFSVNDRGQAITLSEPMDQHQGVVFRYATVTTVAALSTGTVSYTVTAAKSMFLKSVIASSSGAPCRVQVDYVEPGPATTVVAVGFYSAANPFLVIPFHQPPVIAAGNVLNVKILNNAASAQDLYATIMGHERND